MKKDFIIEQRAESRWVYKFTEINKKGETLLIEICKCNNLGGNNSLPHLWHKKGYINRELETYWSIDSCITDTEGNCWGAYNPQVKLSEDEKRHVINFDWMFEATDENLQKLIDEVFRLFSTAEGETATEKKIRKVKEYASINNIEFVTELPNGWQILKNALTAPCGSVWIDNMESFRSGKRKTMLLLNGR